MNNSPEDESLERYLDRLCYALFLMPEAEAAAVRQELRQHLLTMIAMHEAEGLSEPKAVRTALKGFGDPRKIGKEMMAAWFIKRDAMLGIERPRYAKIPDRVICLYQVGSGVGLGWTLVSNLNGSHFSWAAVVISATTWGSVCGLMEAAKTEPSQQPPRVSVEPGSQWDVSNAKQALNKRVAQLMGQKPSRQAVGKLARQLAIQGLLLVTWMIQFGAIPLMVTLFVFLISGWLAKEAARRVNHKTRRVR